MPDDERKFILKIISEGSHVLPNMDSDFFIVFSKEIGKFENHLTRLYNQHEDRKKKNKERKEAREIQKKKEQEAGQKKWDKMKEEQLRHREEMHGESLEEKEKEDGTAEEN